MLKLKSLIKEGFAWERKADGSLPTLKDAIAVHEANSGSKPDFLDLDKDGNKKEPMKSAAADNSSTNYGNYINKARAKSHLTKKDGTVYGHAGKVATKLNSPSDADNTKYTKFTIKSESVNAYKDAELKEGRNDHGLLDLVSEAEDKIQRLRSNMATNSVLQREEKMGYLGAYDELLDILSEIGYQAEMMENN